MARPSILVIGAGELGNAVLDALSAHPAREGAFITVLLRPSSLDAPSSSRKAELERWAEMSIETAKGDIEAASQTELASIFARFETVVGCSGMTASPGIQVKLAKAAIQAKIGRYIPWQFGVDYDTIGPGSTQHLFDEQLEVRATLRSQSSIRWLIVSVGVFMSFVFEPSFGMVDIPRNIVRAFGSWDNQLTITTVQDVGRTVAEAVLNGAGIWDGTSGLVHNGVIFVAGDTLDYKQLAEKVSGALRKEVQREIWTVDWFKKRLGESPDDTMKMYGAVWAAGEGVAWEKSSTFNEAAGISMTTVEEYARAIV